MSTLAQTPAARHRPKPLRRVGAARVIPEAPTPRPDAQAQFVEHPDGWYWVAPDRRQQFGPFTTAVEARADFERGFEGAPEEGETLQDAEAEPGLADWIDPDTGTLAEGPAPRIDDQR
jgi:hypothetical protein